MATAQLIRPKKVTQERGPWNAIFPAKLISETQSTLFMKKLLAIAVSNIAYLRALFPEDAFCDRSIDNLNLKVLRDDSDCEGAVQMCAWIKGCFDALEKKYIYDDEKNPDNVLESYTFKFAYTAGGPEMDFQGESKTSVPHDMAETRSATCRLLRTVVVLTQSLSALPSTALVTMKILYHSEVTPPDYEPPGFQASKGDFSFVAEAVNIKAGEVTTPFHTMRARIKTSRHQFDENPTVGDYVRSQNSSLPSPVY